MQTFSPLFAKFAGFRPFLYLCSVKRIAYIAPIDYIRGGISGRQSLKYNGGSAYSIPAGQSVTADSYTPRMVAQVYRLYSPRMLRVFQVRTRTTVNMTARHKFNIAILGGAGAIYASLVNHSDAQIYADIVAAKNATNIKGITLRQFVMPLVMQGLRSMSARIDIATGVYIVNPWISVDNPNVPVSASILDKFRQELSN